MATRKTTTTTNTASGVLTLNQPVRTSSRRPRLTNDEYRTRKAFAESVVGYNSTSPIWGKQIPEILDLLTADLDAGNVKAVRETIQELRKRIAQQRMISTR
jgi:hypothetical protein